MTEDELAVVLLLQGSSPTGDAEANATSSIGPVSGPGNRPLGRRDTNALDVLLRLGLGFLTLDQAPHPAPFLRR